MKEKTKYILSFIKGEATLEETNAKIANNIRFGEPLNEALQLIKDIQINNSRVQGILNQTNQLIEKLKTLSHG